MNDVQRVSCASCNATILPSTGQLYDGYCAPCFKRLNATPPVVHQPPKKELLGGLFEFLFPIGFAILFFLAVPLGFKFVLGDRKTPVTKGTVSAITLVHPINDVVVVGRPAKVMSGFVVVDLVEGKRLWIPTANVAAMEFAETK